MHGDWKLQKLYPKCSACNGKGKNRFPDLHLNIVIPDGLQQFISRSIIISIACTCMLADWRTASTLTRNSLHLLRGRGAEAWGLLLLHHWEAVLLWSLLGLADFPLSAGRWNMHYFPHTQFPASSKESVQWLNFTWLSTFSILIKWTGSWSNSLPNWYWSDPRVWNSFGGTSTVCFCTSVKTSFCLQRRNARR